MCELYRVTSKCCHFYSHLLVFISMILSFHKWLITYKVRNKLLKLETLETTASENYKVIVSRLIYLSTTIREDIKTIMKNYSKTQL